MKGVQCEKKCATLIMRTHCGKWLAVHWSWNESTNLGAPKKIKENMLTI